LQKHSLIEADVNVLGERVKQVAQHSRRFLQDVEGGDDYKPCDPPLIMERAQTLEDAYAELVRLAVERRSWLKAAPSLYKLLTKANGAEQ